MKLEKFIQDTITNKVVHTDGNVEEWFFKVNDGREIIFCTVGKVSRSLTFEYQTFWYKLVDDTGLSDKKAKKLITKLYPQYKDCKFYVQMSTAKYEI